MARITPNRVSATPVVARIIPNQVSATPVVVRITPNQVSATPVVVRTTPKRVSATPVMARTTPNQVSATPTTARIKSSPYLCVNFVSMFFPSIYLVICWFCILWCSNIFYPLRRLEFVKGGLSLDGLQPMQLGSVNGCCSQCFLSKLCDKRIFYCLDQAIRL